MYGDVDTLVSVQHRAVNLVRAANEWRTRLIFVQILIVSQHDTRGFQWAALAAGVSGYVIKSNVARDLIPELRRIQNLRKSA